MDILIIGGIYSETSKYNNAVFLPAQSMSEKEVIYLMDISKFPYTNKFKLPVNFRIIQPGNFNIITGIFNSYKVFRAISPYINILSIYGLACFFRCLANVTELGSFLKTMKPDVVHIHSTDLERSIFLDYFLNMEHAPPLVVTIHGLYSLDANILSPYDAFRLENDLLNKVIANDGTIVFVSTGIKEAAIKKFNLAADGHMQVIVNGVDLSRFKGKKMSERDGLYQKYGIPPGKFVIIQVGTLYKLKNHLVVLESILNMEGPLRDRIHYVIVGDGEEKQNLADYCIKHNLSPYCTFAGKRFDSELVELYSISDAVIVPSTTEAFPLVFLEALSMGLPVLTFSDLWPAADFYDPDYMILFKRRDIPSVIDGIRRAIDTSWDKNKIASHADRYDWDCIASRYIDLYKSLVKGARAED